MGRYVARRLAFVAVVLAVVTLITFLIYFVMPGNERHDPMFWYWTHGTNTYKQDKVRTHDLGLDQPLISQYGEFLGHLVLGDSAGWPGFGYSLKTREPLLPILASRMLVSLQVIIGAAILWLALSTPIGLLGAVRPRSWPDRLSVILVLVGVSCPVFLLGDVTLYLLAYRFHVVPGTGFISLGSGGILDWLGHLILPWVVLSLWFSALYSRMWRSSMRDTLAQDFIRTARATGASEPRVIFRHGMRASMTTIITMLGMDIGTLIGGAIIVEKLFGIPGLGNYLLQSVAAGDITALASISLLAGVTVTIANLVVDLIQAFLDPRIRFAA